MQLMGKDLKARFVFIKERAEFAGLDIERSRKAAKKGIWKQARGRCQWIRRLPFFEWGKLN